MVARIKGKNIHWKEIDGEKIIYYRELLEDLKTLEYPFSSFVIDGRRGVKKLLESMFPELPIQHCQFHQKRTVISYISTKPRLEASKELLLLVKFLTKMTQLNFSVSEISGESLLMRLDLENISLSLGSACSAGMTKPSHVLLALGRDEELANTGIRLTMGRSTTEEKVLSALKKISEVIVELREGAEFF